MDAVVGMFIMLGIAMLLGIVILIGEHIVYRRFLPYFRSQPKGTLWRSPNLMFFSQVSNNKKKYPDRVNRFNEPEKKKNDTDNHKKCTQPSFLND